MTPEYCHEKIGNNESIYACLVDYKTKYWGYLCELGTPEENGAAGVDAKAIAICKRWKKLQK